MKTKITMNEVKNLFPVDVPFKQPFCISSNPNIVFVRISEEFAKAFNPITYSYITTDLNLTAIWVTNFTNFEVGYIRNDTDAIITLLKPKNDVLEFVPID